LFQRVKIVAQLAMMELPAKHAAMAVDQWVRMTVSVS